VLAADLVGQALAHAHYAILLESGAAAFAGPIRATKTNIKLI
jgi:hypothetical protein